MSPVGECAFLPAGMARSAVSDSRVADADGSRALLAARLQGAA